MRWIYTILTDKSRAVAAYASTLPRAEGYCIHFLQNEKARKSKTQIADVHCVKDTPGTPSTPMPDVELYGQTTTTPSLVSVGRNSASKELEEICELAYRLRG